MPVYNLYCEDCLLDIEIECSVSEYDNRMKNIVCPECTSRKVYRNYQNDNVYSSVREVKTIGQLADANTKKYRSQLNEEDAKKKESQKEQKPWYINKDTTASTKEINNMTKEQQKKYIMEGKK